MRIQSQFKGIISFDALFSLIPLLLMFLFLMQMMQAMSEDIMGEERDTFDKLVSIADYTVKVGAARKEGGLRYPNWIDGIPDYTDLQERSNLSRLYISLSEPEDDYSICIYRLVVVGDQKKIKRVFVCGD